MSVGTARRLRQNLTEAERRLWAKLRRRQVAGVRFRHQASLGRYVVDFLCFEEKLVIEVDGGQHALEEAADAVRTAWLEGEGFRVLRFWNNEVMQNLDGVVQAIRLALSR